MNRIHKRAMSLLLSTVMVLTMLPVTAMALTVESVPYLDPNGSPSSAKNVKAIRSSSSDLSDGWYVVDSGDVTIDQTVTVDGDVKLILADGANLTVNATSGDNAGIKVTQGNSLSIYAQSTGSGMGRLTATGSDEGAGIGSGDHDACGTISIYGGRITATGGSGPAGAPGIGDVTGAGTHFGTIGIYGGFITATNGLFANQPDIGGYGDSTDSITIRGGTIVSNWSSGQVTLGNHDTNLTMPKLVLEGGSIQIGAMIGSASDPNPLKTAGWFREASAGYYQRNVRTLHRNFPSFFPFHVYSRQNR